MDGNRNVVQRMEMADMNRCVLCKKRQWLWNNDGSCWHPKCRKIWETGYDIAIKFCNDENRFAGFPTAMDMYRERMRNY